MAVRDRTNVLLVGGRYAVRPAIWPLLSLVRHTSILRGCVIDSAVSGESIQHKIALSRWLAQVVADTRDYHK